MSSTRPKVISGTFISENANSFDFGWQGLLACGINNYVQIIEPDTVQLLQTLERHKHPVHLVKWSLENFYHDLKAPYSLRLASADTGGQIAVWQAIEATILAEFSENGKPALDMHWVPHQDMSHDLLAVLHGGNELILWNADTGMKLWRKTYAETLLTFCIDPYDIHNVIFRGSTCVLVVNDFSLTKPPSSSGRKFFICSPGNESNAKKNSSDKRLFKSSQLLKATAKLVKGDFLLGGGDKPSEDSETQPVGDCLQLLFHNACRNHVIFVYPREILIMDLMIFQTVTSIALEKSVPTFTQVFSCSQRDLLYCLHENGSLTVRGRRPELVSDSTGASSTRDDDSSPHPSSSSVADTSASGDSSLPAVESPPPSTSAMLEAGGYDVFCQSDSIRLTKQIRLLAMAVDRGREMTVGIATSDGRIQFWRLRVQPPHRSLPSVNSNNSNLVRIMSPASVPSLRLSLADTVAPLVDYHQGPVEGDGPGLGHLRLVLVGLHAGLASYPTVLRMCPPLTRRHMATYRPLLAMGTSRGVLQIWDLSSASLWREYQLMNCPILGLEWCTAAAALFAFGHQGGTSTSLAGSTGGSGAGASQGGQQRVRNELIHVDLMTGQATSLRQDKEAESPIEFMKISHLRQYLAIGFKDKPLEIWDAKHFILLRELPASLPRPVTLEWSANTRSSSMPKSQSMGVVESLSVLASGSGSSGTHAPATGGSHSPAVPSSTTVIADLVSVEKKSPPTSPPVVGVPMFRPPSLATVSSGNISGSLSGSGMTNPTASSLRETFICADTDGTMFLLGVDGSTVKEGSKIPPDAGMNRIAALAWKGDLMAIGDIEGNLVFWELRAKTSRGVTTGGLGAVRKLRFAPGVNFYHLLVLCVDGVAVWDAKEFHLVSSVRCPRDLPRVIDSEWASSDIAVLLTQDGVLRLVDPSKSLLTSCSPLNEEDLSDPVLVPSLLPPKVSLTVRHLLQHQPWRPTYQLLCPSLGDGFDRVENRANRVFDLMRLNNLAAPFESPSTSLVDRCLWTAELFGDEYETRFWRLANSYLPRSNQQPAAPPLDSGLDVLAERETYRQYQLARLAVLEKKRCTPSQTQRCAESLILLGQLDRAVRLLLETPPTSPSYLLDLHRACLLANTTTNSTTSVNPHHSTVKLVATNLISNQHLSEGAQLLCMIGKTGDACRYLEYYKEWNTAVWLAKCALPSTESTEVLKRWANYLASPQVNEKSLALLVLVMLGQHSQVLESLYSLHQFLLATRYLEACQQFGLLDAAQETVSLSHAIFLEAARAMTNLGHREGAAYYCDLAGSKGAQLKREMEFLLSH